MARGRRALVDARHDVARRRLGLRRHRLHGRRSRCSGTMGDLDDAGRRGRAARDAACCSTSSRTTRASSTPGSSTPGRLVTSAHRDWYVWADPKPDGSLAEQLGQQLRRAGVDVRRAPPASTTCTTSRPSSPTSTGGTRTCATSSTAFSGSGSTAASPGFRIDVVPHDRQGPRAARQPARRQPTTRGSSRSRGSARSTTRAVPRCTTCCAAGGRSPTPTTRPSCSLGETFLHEVAQVVPFYGRAGERARPRVRHPDGVRDVRRRRARRSRRARPRRELPAGAQPCYTGGNHDVVPVPDALGRRRSRPVRVRAADAADAARHAGPLLRRRARACPTPTSPSIASSTRSAGFHAGRRP